MEEYFGIRQFDEFYQEEAHWGKIAWKLKDFDALEHLIVDGACFGTFLFDDVFLEEAHFCKIALK